ncbi:MAG: HNH endonuclease [Bdellovibrionales bacterium]|nr:HNH endonuclease [Bdellovibrionales bacterium]
MTNFEELKSIDDKDLLVSISQLRIRERECIAELVFFLSEINRRKLYRDVGHSSLFTFCTEKLGYSEASAYRRVQAAKAIDLHPEVYGKLKEGELTLLGVAELSKVLTKENWRILVKAAQGKNTKELAELVAEIKPAVVRKVETIKAIKPTQPMRVPMTQQTQSTFTVKAQVEYKVSIVADQEFMSLYSRVKALVPGNRSAMLDVLRVALEEYEKRHCPKQRSARRERRKASLTPRTTKAIAQAIKDEVYLRDRGQCTFVSPDGKRCSSTRHLEFDHIVPKAKGGRNTPENLRLLCRSHNLLAAEREFGTEFMQKFTG